MIKIDVGDKFNKFLSGVEDITYEQLMKRVEKLNETQRRIITEMKNIVEADSTTIGELVGLSRVGALKQLKHLEKAGFINSMTKNRKTIYQLREEIEYGTEE